MVPENCRESLLIEKFCGGQKITFALSQGRGVVGIGSWALGRGSLTPIKSSSGQNSQTKIKDDPILSFFEDMFQDVFHLSQVDKANLTFYDTKKRGIT